MSASTVANDDSRMLFLFIAGQSPRSRRAAAALESALEAAGLPRDGYVAIDVLTAPEKISEFGVFATPALIRVADSGPPEVLYGELSDREKLDRFLG